MLFYLKRNLICNRLVCQGKGTSLQHQSQAEDPSRFLASASNAVALGPARWRGPPHRWLHLGHEATATTCGDRRVQLWNKDYAVCLKAVSVAVNVSEGISALELLVAFHSCCEGEPSCKISCSWELPLRKIYIYQLTVGWYLVESRMPFIWKP